ncbi:MAG TPA: WD40 repeat domain-containing protein, partial [Prolixibacteraceae bacterium]|nr:WD40 repeat domain-containing protein [Prolixibacteraceae bacterium]
MKILFLYLLLVFIPAFLSAQKPRLVIQSGHQSEILSASVSPDGKYLLSVERDALAILWDLKSGRQLLTFKDVMAAGFSSDGTSIELVTDDYSFRKTDYSGKVLHTYASTTKGPDRMNRILWSYYPENGFLDMNGALYDRDKGLIKVLDIPRYSPVHYYSAQLNQLAVLRSDQVTLCNYPSGEIARTLPLTLGKEDGEKFVQVSPDGQWLVAGNRKDLNVVDLSSGAVKFNFRYGDLSGSYRYFELCNAAFSGDSRSLAVWTPGSLILYDLATGKEKWKVPQYQVKINEHGSTSGALLFTPDNRSIVFGGGKKLAVADALTGRIEKVISSPAIAWLDASIITNNGQQLVVKSGRTHLVNWNLASGGMEKAVPTGDLADCFDVSSDGKSFFVFPDRAFMKKLDATGKVLKEYETSTVANLPSSVFLSYDGKYLATTGRFACDTCYSTFRESHDLYVYDALTGNPLLRKPGAAAIGAFANKSNRLAFKDEYDKFPLKVMEIPSGKLLFEVKMPDAARYPSRMQFSPTDKYLLFHALYAYLVDIETKNVTTIDNKLPSGQNCITAAFMPDEKYLVMGSGDGKLFFWDILNSRFDTSLTMDLSNIAIEGISFSPSGRFLFVNTQENFIQLWDLSLKKLAATLYPNTTTNDWAVITPDGRFDASPEAQNYMFYLRGLDIFPLSVLFEQFYTPDLLPRLLAGEVFPPVEVDINTIKPAPTVAIDYQEG